jgi:hypothetical protein
MVKREKIEDVHEIHSWMREVGGGKSKPFQRVDVPLGSPRLDLRDESSESSLLGHLGSKPKLNTFYSGFVSMFEAPGFSLYTDLALNGYHTVLTYAGRASLQRGSHKFSHRKTQSL